MEQIDPRYAELIARESRLDAEYGRIHSYYNGLPNIPYTPPAQVVAKMGVQWALNEQAKFHAERRGP